MKAVELKEELKRCKLPTKGLKEELIRRLDEALRQEQNAAHSKAENGSDSSPGPDEEMVEPIDEESPNANFDADNITYKKADQKMSKIDAAENRVSLDERKFSNEEPIDGAIFTIVKTVKYPK